MRTSSSTVAPPPADARPCVTTGGQRRDDELVRVGMWLTRSQVREVSMRAGVGPLDGRARGEYIVGCLFREPEADLLRRVAEIRDSDRARFRAEAEADQLADCPLEDAGRVAEVVPLRAARD